MTVVLQAKGVTAGYGGQPAIDEIDLTVNAGEVVALLGANGAGKTTTLLSLVGELPLQSGEVAINGAKTTKGLHMRARNGLAFVPEGRTVFKGMSTLDNIRVASVDVARVLALFPELERSMKTMGGLLSGGEQQMLTLGRALARDPKLLLADELSLGLAPKVVSRLLQAVRDASRESGMGVLLVEQHVRKVLRYADRVYLLRRGRIQLELSAGEARARIDEIEKSYLANDLNEEA